MKGQDIRLNNLDLPLQEHQQRPEDCKISKRNFSTIQSALVRGDTEATLFNRDPLQRERWYIYHRSDVDIDQIETRDFHIWESKSKPQSTYDALAQTAQRDIQSWRWYGLQFKFVKVLAKGGHGYVSLWDVMFDDNSVRRVVIKKGLNASFKADKESQFHLRYQGAEHTTQVIDLNREARKIHEAMKEDGSFYTSQISQGNLWNATQQNCVVFEYAPWGDMVDMLTKVAVRKVHFTDQVLWGIWECFVLGLASIAYQPFIDVSFESQWATAKAMNQTKDFLDHVENWKIMHDVHLDLEVFNILAGHNEESHPYQPVFKIHDLGAWSFKMTDEWETKTEAGYWQMRGPVKIHGLTPEQFSKEWDHLGISKDQTLVKESFAGDDFTKGNVVAGRFGSWTNTFLIARVMESTMTGIYSRFPLQSAPHYTKNGMSAAQTYGWMLQTPEFAHIDPGLRDIVSQCLYERPQDRPSIIKLLRNIAARRAKGFGEPPEAVGKWWADFLAPSEERQLSEQPRPNVVPAQQTVADQLNPVFNPNAGLTSTAVRQLGEALKQWHVDMGRAGADVVHPDPLAGAGAGPANQGASQLKTTKQKKHNQASQNGTGEIPETKKASSDASFGTITGLGPSSFKQSSGRDFNPPAWAAQDEMPTVSNVSSGTRGAQGMLPGKHTKQDVNPQPWAEQKSIVKEVAPDVSSGTKMAQEMLLGLQTNGKHSNAQTRITHGLLPEQTGQDTNPHSSATQERIAKQVAPDVSHGTRMGQEMLLGMQASKENTNPRTGAQNRTAALLETQEMFQHNSEDEDIDEDIYGYSRENIPDGVLPPFAPMMARRRAQQAAPAESSSPPAFLGAIPGHTGAVDPESEPKFGRGVEPESDSPEAPPRWVVKSSSESTAQPPIDNYLPSEMDTNNDDTMPLQPANTGSQAQQPPSGSFPFPGMGWFQPRTRQQQHEQQDRPPFCSPLLPLTHGYRDPLNQNQDSADTPENGTLNRATARAARSVGFAASPKSVKSSKVSKRSPKTKKARRISSPQSSDAITAYVQKWLLDMPVAIRNLVTRSKHLDAQIKGGHLPVYAYMN